MAHITSADIRYLSEVRVPPEWITYKREIRRPEELYCGSRRCGRSHENVDECTSSVCHLRYPVPFPRGFTFNESLAVNTQTAYHVQLVFSTLC